MIAPEVRQRWVTFNAPLEGRVSWMYLDVRGLVTTAIGILIDPMEAALHLPWVTPAGVPATRAEIEADWRAVKRQTSLARKGAGAAASVARLRLTPEGVEQVTLAKLDVMARALVDDFPALPSWPWEAQMATLSLCWAVGTALPRGWPRLTSALREEDWIEASRECEIRSEGNLGVVPRNEQNRLLYLEAASERETVPPVVTDGEVRQLQAETFESLARDLLAEGYRRR